MADETPTPLIGFLRARLDEDQADAERRNFHTGMCLLFLDPGGDCSCDYDSPVSHDAALELRDAGTPNERVVVTRADREIWIHPELWEQMLYDDNPHVDFDGVLLTFGTEGEGLGRLTYGLISQPDPDADPFDRSHFAVLTRRYP